VRLFYWILYSNHFPGWLTVVHVPPGTTCNDAVATRESAAASAIVRKRIVGEAWDGLQRITRFRRPTDDREYGVYIKATPFYTH
jgi:hypothetical protein